MDVVMSNVPAVFFASPGWRLGCAMTPYLRLLFFSSLVVSGSYVVADTVLDQLCDGQEDEVTAMTITPKNFGAPAIDEILN